MSQIPNRDAIKSLVRELLEQNQSNQQPDSQNPTAQPSTDESLKEVITTAEVEHLPPQSTIIIRADALITPSAQDVIRGKQLQIQYRKRQQKAGASRILALGADHGGYETKEKLKQQLSALGFSLRDFGTNSGEAVDYPDFAHAVARAVADGHCDLGIILDGAGIGSCMTANKVPGVRAAMCYDAASARNSREHNYANVLTLGAKMLSFEKIWETVEVWLQTEEGEARHGKRVAKITAIEKQYLR